MLIMLRQVAQRTEKQVTIVARAVCFFYRLTWHSSFSIKDICYFITFPGLVSNASLSERAYHPRSSPSWSLRLQIERIVVRCNFFNLPRLLNNTTTSDRGASSSPELFASATNWKWRFILLLQDFCHLVTLSCSVNNATVSDGDTSSLPSPSCLLLR